MSCNELDGLEELRKISDETLETMKREIGRILRSKGLIWLATRSKFNVEWSHAGVILTLSPGMTWSVECFIFGVI